MITGAGVSRITRNSKKPKVLIKRLTSLLGCSIVLFVVKRDNLTFQGSSMVEHSAVNR